MNAFERDLLNIPQDEASAYFLRLTGRDKTASAHLEEAWNELTSDEQDEILKEAAAEGLLDEKLANMMGAGGAGPMAAMAKPGPPPAQMPMPSPTALPSTAQGMNSVKTAAQRMKEAAVRLKIAFDAQGATPSPSSGNDEDEPSLEEYLQAEAVGEQAEEQASSEFYKTQLQQTQQQLQEAQAQAEQTQQQAEQLQQQVSQNDETIQASMQQAQMAQQSAMTNVQQAHEMAMQATTQAMESQAEVLRQKQFAAAMRMGVQTLKDNVMGAMANDPTDQLAQQLQAPPPGSAGMVGGQPPAPPPPVDPATGMPMADPAMAGQDPAAAGAPPVEGAPPLAEGGGEKKPAKKEEKDDKGGKDGKTSVEVKTGAALRFQELTRGLRRNA